MSDRVFIDTNIIIYSYSSTERQKQFIAQKLITESNSYISTQVLTEFCNILLKKFRINHSAIIAVLEECHQNHSIFINNEDTIQNAVRIAERYKFSFYDSLILSSALYAECDILYSEDLNNGQIINDKLTIINPFVEKNS